MVEGDIHTGPEPALHHKDSAHIDEHLRPARAVTYQCVCTHLVTLYPACSINSTNRFMGMLVVMDSLP